MTETKPGWEVETKNLLEVVKILDLVPMTSGLPASSYVQLQSSGNEMHMALASGIAGWVKIKTAAQPKLKKPIYVDRTLLFPFLLMAQKYQSEKPFVFSLSDTNLVVLQGRRRGLFEFADSGSGYVSSVDRVGGDKLSITDDVIRLLVVASSNGTAEQTMSELGCVYLSKNGSGVDVYATNQLVIFKSTAAFKEKFPARLAFPLELISLLKTTGLGSIVVGEKDIWLEFSFGCIWQSLSVKATTEFPQATIDKITAESRKWPGSFSLSAQKFYAVAERFASYLYSAKKEEWLLSVRGQAGNNFVVLQASIPQGTFREKFPVLSALKADTAVEWPLDLLLPTFEYLAADEKASLNVSFTDKSPYLIRSGQTNVFVTRRKV